jgi:hypothetical protein
MCSMASAPGHVAPGPADDVAARLARAIDDYAAAALHSGEAADPDIAGRLAALWAMLTDADPELAARAARYASP